MAVLMQVPYRAASLLAVLSLAMANRAAPALGQTGLPGQAVASLFSQPLSCSFADTVLRGWASWSGQPGIQRPAAALDVDVNSLSIASAAILDGATVEPCRFEMKAELCRNLVRAADRGVGAAIMAVAANELRLVEGAPGAVSCDRTPTSARVSAALGMLVEASRGGIALPAGGVASLSAPVAADALRGLIDMEGEALQRGADRWRDIAPWSLRTKAAAIGALRTRLRASPQPPELSSRIAHLVVGGALGGSGYFIGPCHVTTAAHVLTGRSNPNFRETDLLLDVAGRTEARALVLADPVSSPRPVLTLERQEGRVTWRRSGFDGGSAQVGFGLRARAALMGAGFGYARQADLEPTTGTFDRSMAHVETAQDWALLRLAECVGEAGGRRGEIRFADWVQDIQRITEVQGEWSRPVAGMGRPQGDDGSIVHLNLAGRWPRTGAANAGAILRTHCFAHPGLATLFRFFLGNECDLPSIPGNSGSALVATWSAAAAGLAPPRLGSVPTGIHSTGSLRLVVGRAGSHDWGDIRIASRASFAPMLWPLLLAESLSPGGTALFRARCDAGATPAAAVAQQVAAARRDGHAPEIMAYDGRLCGGTAAPPPPPEIVGAWCRVSPSPRMRMARFAIARVDQGLALRGFDWGIAALELAQAEAVPVRTHRYGAIMHMTRMGALTPEEAWEAVFLLNGPDDLLQLALKARPGEGRFQLERFVMAAYRRCALETEAVQGLAAPSR